MTKYPYGEITDAQTTVLEHLAKGGYLAVLAQAPYIGLVHDKEGKPVAWIANPDNVKLLPEGYTVVKIPHWSETLS